MSQNEEEGYCITVESSTKNITLEVVLGSKKWKVALDATAVKKITEEAGYERGLQEFSDLIACGIEGGTHTVAVDVCDYEGLLDRNGSQVPREIPAKYKKKLYVLIDYNVSYGRALYTIILNRDSPPTAERTVERTTRPTASTKPKRDPQSEKLMKEVAELRKLNRSLYNRAKKDSDLIEGYETRERKMKRQLISLKEELAEVHRELLNARRTKQHGASNRVSSRVMSGRPTSRSSSITSRGSRDSKGSAGRHSTGSRGRASVASSTRSASRCSSVRSTHSYSSAGSSTYRRHRYTPPPPAPRPFVHTRSSSPRRWK
eukprot:TRINITY_DN6077_c3_g1_i1.p1 TRINITY_DN6077_c3_g1~~TRINITY_DN6077_c3_g1_i1.p1  ORF type:complete len:331 (+),score=56.26 TRINITY_DN6077_c3_g1_i1:43-993(+)